MASRNSSASRTQPTSNALAEKQSVTFGPQLTVIFGANGSGKSGYARIFGSSCFTRGDRDVLPNMFKAGAEALPRTASIAISTGGKERTISYRFDLPVPELAAFYVFDTTCVSSHLEKANTLTFSPAGLSALNELVRHTDKVREIASARIAAATAPHDFARLFAGGATVTSAQIATLNAATEPVILTQLATLSDAENARSEQLEREIAEIRLLDVPKAVRTLRGQVRLLQSLRATIEQNETELGDTRLGELAELLRERTRRRENATRAGAEQFAVEGLRAVALGSVGRVPSRCKAPRRHRIGSRSAISITGRAMPALSAGIVGRCSATAPSALGISERRSQAASC